jgi:hypothetical protein
MELFALWIWTLSAALVNNSARSPGTEKFEKPLGPTKGRGDDAAGCSSDRGEQDR